MSIINLSWSNSEYEKGGPNEELSGNHTKLHTKWEKEEAVWWATDVGSSEVEGGERPQV